MGESSSSSSPSIAAWSTPMRLLFLGETRLLTYLVGAAAELFSRSMPTAATFSLISSASLAFSRLAAVCFSIGVGTLALLAPPAPALALMDDFSPFLFSD